MNTIIISVGRNIAYTSGQLHSLDWTDFVWKVTRAIQEELPYQTVCTQSGKAKMWSDSGIEEDTHTWIVKIYDYQESTSLRNRLAEIAEKFRQVEIGFTYGFYAPVQAGNKPTAPTAHAEAAEKILYK